MQKIVLPLILIFFFSCKNENKTNENFPKTNNAQEFSIMEKIANAYGYENWDEITRVEFSFVVNPGEKESLRQWIWDIEKNEVSMYSNNKEVVYNRNEISDNSLNADKAFVNDSFWLLFPFHLVWDDITYEVVENVFTPLENVEATKLIVQYPKEGGYTPGDRYDVYIDDKFHILEWTYHPKGQVEPALANTFEDLSTFNGIKVNMIHRNEDINFQLVFRNVSFK